MKTGDTVYRKAPYRVIAVGQEKNEAGDVIRTHIQLQAVENTQYINCLDTDVEAEEPAAPSPLPSGEQVSAATSEVPLTNP